MNAHQTIDTGRAGEARAAWPVGHVLVVGLGATGLSCVRHLAGPGRPDGAGDPGRRIVAVDSRRHPPCRAAVESEFPEVEIRCGGFDAPVFDTAAEIVVSPGVSVREPALQAAAARGVPIVGDIELFARAADAPVVAITGSNGKSTVTSLVAAMALSDGVRAGSGGNLGPPALTLLGRGHELYVLELSSFQLETTSALRPAAAAVLNISADHMDRYESLDAYVAAKSRALGAIRDRFTDSGGKPEAKSMDSPVIPAKAGIQNATLLPYTIPRKTPEARPFSSNPRGGWNGHRRRGRLRGSKVGSE